MKIHLLVYLHRGPVDILAHSFGTAVASALVQKLQVGVTGHLKIFKVGVEA